MASGVRFTVEALRDRDAVRAWARRLAPGGRVAILAGPAGGDERVAVGLRHLGLHVDVYRDELAAVAGCGASRPDVALLSEDFPSADLDRLVATMLDVLDLPPVVLADDGATPRAGRCAVVARKASLDEVIGALAPHLRRHSRSGPPLVVGALELDRGGCDARFAGRRLPVGASEQALLAHLMDAAGRTLTRQDLVSWLRLGSADPDAFLSTLVARLRRAFDDVGAPGAITTVRRVGYRLEPDSLGVTRPALRRGA
jgi:DNA-binding response OmpR family regulator